MENSYKVGARVEALACAASTVMETASGRNAACPFMGAVNLPGRGFRFQVGISADRENLCTRQLRIAKLETPTAFERPAGYPHSALQPIEHIKPGQVSQPNIEDPVRPHKRRGLRLVRSAMFCFTSKPANIWIQAGTQWVTLRIDKEPIVGWFMKAGFQRC